MYGVSINVSLYVQYVCTVCKDRFVFRNIRMYVRVVYVCVYVCV